MKTEVYLTAAIVSLSFQAAYLQANRRRRLSPILLAFSSSASRRRLPSSKQRMSPSVCSLPNRGPAPTRLRFSRRLNSR